MRAAIFDAPGKMRVGEWAAPKPGPNEVLITVKAAGICAGDMYIYQGRNPYAVYPIIGGHEICGSVADVGENVRGLRTGQLVVIEPFLGCGKCYPCRIGKSNCCANLRIIGVHLPGGYADLVAAPATHIHPVPAGLSATMASFAESLAIGVQACRRGAVKAAEYVLILGAGPIGLALIEVTKARGAHPVVADINEARLAFAKTLGADVLKADDQLMKHVLDQTNGEGAPAVIEATGDPVAMQQTVNLVASGGRIVIVGLVKKGTMVPFPGLDFTRKEMTLVGSRASVNCFPESLELLASGKIHYPKVATQFNMWDAPGVFAQLNADPGVVHKGVLLT
jgi:2-desacetyl-2-hydroxyethyl bacteriochlorophyllide A dehydrogenase